MKDYLNYEQRQHSAYYGMFWSIIEKDLENDSKNKSKGELKALRTTKTQLVNYMKALLERVGDKEFNRICKIVDECTLEMKRSSNGRKQMIVFTDLFLRMVRKATKLQCSECTREDFQNCQHWQDMYELGLMSKGDNGGKCDFMQLEDEE